MGLAMEHKIAAARVNRLFTHCLEQLEQHAATTSPRLSDAQNALLAYLRLDKIAEDEGFATLIALGYGEEFLCGTLAEQLAAWGLCCPILCCRRGACIVSWARRLGSMAMRQRCASRFRSLQRWMNGILWSARRFFRRCITMCGGILMRLRRCWIFRLPKWLGNQRTLRFAFLLFGEILLRVFCKEKYFCPQLDS